MIINDSQDTWVITPQGGLTVKLEPNEAWCCVTNTVLKIDKPTT